MRILNLKQLLSNYYQSTTKVNGRKYNYVCQTVIFCHPNGEEKRLSSAIIESNGYGNYGYIKTV